MLHDKHLYSERHRLRGSSHRLQLVLHSVWTAPDRQQTSSILSLIQMCVAPWWCLPWRPSSAAASDFPSLSSSIGPSSHQNCTECAWSPPAWALLPHQMLSLRSFEIRWRRSCEPIWPQPFGPHAAFEHTSWRTFSQILGENEREDGSCNASQGR